jgi:hypothetical protein
MLTALLAYLVAAAGALDAKTIHVARLRVLDQRLDAIILAGRTRSDTFRALVDRLDRGDVVVYVRYKPLPPGVHGRLTFMAAAGGLRYVMVDLTPTLGESRTIVILGHELRHGVEILDQPDIVDAATFAVAYERVGFRRREFKNGGVGFDTPAAILAGQQVWRELGTAIGHVPMLGTR